MATKKYSKRIVVFDAHAILHRAYHALPDFLSPAGEPTGGLYGVASMLLKIIKDLKPDYMVACYDLPEPTFRKKVYDNYKAGRGKTDDALIAQMDRSRDIFTSFGIPVFDAPGFEADDVIGTIVEKIKDEKDLQVIVASGDMDTMQLVDKDKVVVYTLKKGINDTILYDEKAVVERFGFKPELLPDFKGLRGDPSDNIIGITGIGEKTATTLISKIGTIETIYSLLEKGTKGEEKLLKLGLKPRIVNLLKDGEEEALFSKTLAKIRKDAPTKFELPTTHFRDTLDFKIVEKLFLDLGFKSLLARAKMVLTGEALKKTDPEKEIKVDQELLEKSTIALWLLDSDKTSAKLEDVFDYTGKKDLNLAYKDLLQELKEKDLTKIYEEVELPLVSILKKAKQRGLLIDVKYLHNLSEKYHLELNKLEQKIYDLAGGDFNINSPKQLGEILFDKLGLTAKGLKKTAGGARSTRESELEKLFDSHKIIEPILDYRGLQKLISTYVDVIPKLVDEHNRLHSKLNQTGTTTGRMSSVDPNLQNIPSGGIYGDELRKSFIASPGHIFIAADYSQVELRVLAMLSGDQTLTSIFKEGKDIHTSVASVVFGVPESEVTSDMRRKAKVINFGIIYGMGVTALQKNLNTTRAEASQFYNDYFNNFSTIKTYFDEVVAVAYAKGYTETMFGRRRYFPGLRSKLPFVRAQAERGAMNAPLQGTAADIVKMATINIDQELKKQKLDNNVHFLLQIHDELIYEVEIDKADNIVQLIKKNMEAVTNKNTPLLVNIKKGPTWADLH